MNLLQMSFSGAVLIVVIAAARAVLIEKLPKRTFLALWWITLLRLMIPLAVPSVFSIYSVMIHHTGVAETIAKTPAARMVPVLSGTKEIARAAAGAGWMRHVWVLLWGAGAFFCAAFFAVSYLRCRRGFQISFPVENQFLQEWISAHPLKRSYEVRSCGSIASPLTYGLFHPVILMPRKTDWEDHRQIGYILLHEYEHIRRHDAAVKLIVTLVLCIHWFNPLVWVMYVLFNRDIELACDEDVVRKYGETSRSVYARALIGMEEKKSAFMPLCNNFSKNAIEERVRSIMKFRKISAAAVLAAVLLIGSVTIVFATTAEIENNLSVHKIQKDSGILGEKTDGDQEPRFQEVDSSALKNSGGEAESAPEATKIEMTLIKETGTAASANSDTASAPSRSTGQYQHFGLRISPVPKMRLGLR